jgi:hypothetical protein
VIERSLGFGIGLFEAIHEEIRLGSTAAQLGDDVASGNQCHGERPDSVVPVEGRLRVALLEIGVTYEFGGEERAT